MTSARVSQFLSLVGGGDSTVSDIEFGSGGGNRAQRNHRHIRVRSQD